jgi:hypothetical protein
MAQTAIHTLQTLLHLLVLINIVQGMSLIYNSYRAAEREREHRRFLRLLLEDPDAFEEFREEYYRPAGKNPEVGLKVKSGSEEEKKIEEGRKDRCERCGLVATTRRRTYSTKHFSESGNSAS